MLRIHITGQHGQIPPFEHAGAIEFGRGPQRGEVPRRMLNDPRVHLDHLRVEEDSGRLRLTNLSPQPFRLPNNDRLEPGASVVLTPPVPKLSLGGTAIRIEVDPKYEPVRGSKVAAMGPSPSAEHMTTFFEGLIRESRLSGNESQLGAGVAQMSVENLGLDRAWVLLDRGGGWEVAATFPDEPAGAEAPAPALGDELGRRALQQRKAVHDARGAEVGIASPITGAAGPRGVLYGSRPRRPDPGGPAYGPLEAQVFQLLALHLGARLDGFERDREATRQRNLFEQFFSPALARALEKNPSLLEGCEQVVTVMFVDIRGFSRIAGILGPKRTVELTAEVMDRVTDQVLRQDGVVIDYTGDGLMALWNAPEPQDDHADRACRAALAIVAEMPRITEGWRHVVGGPVALGVGLNTGPAVVGNTGSRYRFKYGALGPTVNLASRVEGATKFVGVPILMTGKTHETLGGDFPTRRVGRFRLVGIKDPVNLFELHAGPPRADWLSARDAYHKALDLFEGGQLQEACRALGPTLAGRDPTSIDGPSLDLLARAVEALRSSAVSFDPVRNLDSK
jgi:adenylate cyclase